MADKAIFEIVVTDKGLKVSQKNVDELGKSVERTRKKTKDAEAASGDLYDKQAKGIIGTANSTKSFSKLSQTIGGSNGLVAAYAGLAANAFAVTAAFGALNRVAQAQTLMQGLVEQGSKAGRTLTILSQQLKDITKDSISSADAMRATAQASAAGISGDDLKKLTEVATNASLALGRDVPDSLNRMVLAVTKMEPELVDELGLTTKITEASEKYARQLGVSATSLNQAQKQQALLNAWVEQGTLKYEGLADAVDPNPYNKLAATFDDLVKSGGNIINKFLNPLISLLATSKGMLAGVGLVFLGSIKNQILPGIQEASNAALKMSKAAKEASIEAVSGQKELGSGRRKAINEFIAASKEGVATQQQFEAAIKESNDRIASAEARKTPLKPATMEKIRADEATRQEELNKIKKEAAKSTVLQAQADGYAASEGVNLTNAYSKLKDTISATGTSYTASYNASKTAEGGLKGLANTATSAGKGIAAAGKVAAVGFINFLPVIGQVIAAISILWELVGKDVWAKLTGRTEAFGAALDNFNEVLANTSKKLKALEQIERSTASAADRAVAIVSNQAATIYELADAYGELIKARLESESQDKKERDNAEQQRNLFQELAQARREGNRERIAQLEAEQKASNVANRLGVSSTSMAARAFAAQSSEVWMDDEYVAAAQALEQLENQLPNVTKAFYDMNGGVDEFNKLDPSIKVQLLNDQLKSTAQLARNVEQAFKSLDQAVNNLNTGYVDFIKSLTPTTEYDAIVGNFEGLTKGINDAKLAIRRMDVAGGDSLQLQDRLSETLTGIEGPARNIFTGGTREILNYFDTIDSSLQNARDQLNGLNEGSADYNRTQSEITRLEGVRKQLLDNNIATIQQEVSAYQKIVTDAQVEQITRQGTLAIAQANLKVLQKQGQVTGEDIEKQMRAENAIIELQAQQLETQITILKQDLEREKSALRLIEANQTLLDTYIKQGEEQRKNNINTQIAAAQTELTSLAGKTDADSARRRAALNSQVLTLESARTDIVAESLRLENERESLTNSIRVKEAAINSLMQQAQALRMGANTEAEILNAKLKKEIENRKQIADINRQVEEMYVSILAAQREIGNLLSMGGKELSNQLASVRDQAKIKREQLESEWHFRELMLNADLQLARARGNSSQVSYYSGLIEAERNRNAVALEQVDIEEQRGRLQVVAIKNVEEENSLRKKSIELTQKLIQAQAEMNQADFDYMTAIVELERKRSGAQDTDASRNTDTIMAAKFAYDQAVAEATVKKQLIELEFQLLKAQRLQSIADLRSRASELRTQADIFAMKEEDRRQAAADRIATAQARGQAPSEEDSIIVTASREARTAGSEQARQQAALLENTANQLEGITTESIDNAANAAITAIDLGIQTLGVKLQTALEPGPRVKDGIMAQFEKYKDLVDEYNTRMQQASILRADNNPANDVADPSKIALATDLVKEHISSLRESFQQLGPEGEVVLAIMDGATRISDAFQDAFDKMGEAGASTGDKIAAGLQAASAVIGAVMSILTSASNARIANVDKEISAEEKRDGKSKASLAKIEAMEKKKDAMARKQFNVNKKLMLAQAVMSTAAGIAATLGDASLPTVARIALAAVIGGMGMAQIALIAGTQYESSYTPKSIETPSSLSIGKRSDTVNLANGPNANAGGELAYLRGGAGTGSNASNYSAIGSAYGGPMQRGYGNSGFVVGEKGPEVITPDTPITVTPANENSGSAPVNATINIQAIDSQGVQDVLVAQKGNIIQMLRQAANASGQRFLEDVNVNVYTRPNVGKLL